MQLLKVNDEISKIKVTVDKEAIKVVNKVNERLDEDQKKICNMW